MKSSRFYLKNIKNKFLNAFNNQELQKYYLWFNCSAKLYFESYTLPYCNLICIFKKMWDYKRLVKLVISVIVRNRVKLFKWF